MSDYGKIANGMPWWLKAIYTLGIPSALATYLVYFLVTTVIGNQRKMEENLNLLSADYAYTVKSMQKLEFLMERICSNTTKNQQERNNCFQQR